MRRVFASLVVIALALLPTADVEGRGIVASAAAAAPAGAKPVGGKRNKLGSSDEGAPAK